MPTTFTTDLALEYHWIVEANEYVQLVIPVLDDLGAPFDPTGWIVDAKVKQRHGPGAPTLHTWLVGDTGTSSAGVTLTILPATSAAWTFTAGWWRCAIQHPVNATQRSRIIQGPFSVSVD